jgi:hypothetical protein
MASARRKPLRCSLNIKCRDRQPYKYIKPPIDSKPFLMYYNQALQIADIDQKMASKVISMRTYLFKSFEYVLTIASNQHQRKHGSRSQACKYCCCQRQGTNHHPSLQEISDMISSPAAYAKRRKLLETNACSSAMPKIPKRIVLRQSTNIRVAWQALVSNFLDGVSRAV